MTNTSPAEVLRRAIANVIAGESARDVPGVCKRYGLAEGTGEEAFSGKFRYVMSRLHALNSAQVLQTGQAALGDYRDGALANAVEVLEDANLPKITMITRRRLLNILNSIVLEGRLSLFEFLEPIYDLDSIQSPYHVSPVGESTRPIRGDVYQHCINNHDWDNEDLLKHLGFLDCHQRQVFHLLERVFDPEIWDDDHPEGGLLDRINQVLKKDGYALQVTGMISGTGIYKVQQVGAPGATPADDEISALVQRFDEAGIRDLWEKACSAATVILMARSRLPALTLSKPVSTSWMKKVSPIPTMLICLSFGRFAPSRLTWRPTSTPRKLSRAFSAAARMS